MNFTFWLAVVALALYLVLRPQLQASKPSHRGRADLDSIDMARWEDDGGIASPGL